MGEASVLKWTVPTILLFLGTFSFYMNYTSAAPFQSTLRLPRDRGCYYLMKHYTNGERIETNEPCLNCTCVNSMLMCYLRICPFTKPAGPECVIKREEGECCPTVWCPGDAIPTPPPTEVPTTQEPLGCFAGGEAYVDGAQLPRNPDNPCEVCYCIRNSTACVMQECELKVEGCTPVYREPSCCPSRYNCSRYVATTLPPGPMPTVMPSGCFVNNHLYADGERVVSENPCNHCYCMRDTVACAVEKCHAPGEGCIPQTIPDGQCCPDRYDCQGMEVAATDITTDEPHTTTPTITSSEGDLTEKVDTTEKEETLHPFSVSADMETTTPSPSAIEEVESTPSQKEVMETTTTVSLSEEKTMVSTVSSRETIQHSSTLTTIPEEIASKLTTILSTTEEQTEIPSSTTTEITQTELKLSSLPDDSKLTSTSVPEIEETTERSSPKTATEGFGLTELLTSTAAEKKEDLSTSITTIVEETTFAHPVSLPKQPVEQITTTSIKDTTTSAPEQYESSTLTEEEETKLTAEMEGRDKVTQMITELSEKTESSEITSPTKKLEELSTTIASQVLSEEITTSTLAPEEETDSIVTTVTSEGPVLKLDTKPTQATTVEEVTAEIELSTTGTTTTAKPILPGSIPGEGNCHYATGTYKNGDPVIPVHPCEKDCVCNNSVVACDIIVCEPVSEDSTNCRIITRQDECCPYYECDAVISQELPPALNQTKMQEIPEKAISSTTVSVETERSEEAITEKPSEKPFTTETVKPTTIKEVAESTTEEKQESVSPFIKEVTTEESIVSQSELFETQEITGSTEPSLDERRAGTHADDFDGETMTTFEKSMEGISTDSSEIPPETPELPDVIPETSSKEEKPSSVSSIIPEDISKETTQFTTSEAAETVSTEATKHITEAGLTELTEGIKVESEKPKLDIEEKAEKETTQTESEVTTKPQTQQPLEVSKELVIVTTEEVREMTSTLLPESTETLELIGDTKPAIQVTDHIPISELSTSITEEPLPESTKIEEFDKTSQDISEYLTTEKTIPVSEETIATHVEASTKITTSEEKMTSEHEETSPTVQTTSFLDTSTQPPAGNETEKAILLTGQTQDTTPKTTSIAAEEATTPSILAATSSEPSRIHDTTMKSLEIVTTQTPSREEYTSDVIDKISLPETTPRDHEITLPTISSTDSKVSTKVAEVEESTLQETTPFSVMETSQTTEKIPGETTLRISTESEAEITEKVKISLEEQTTTKSFVEETAKISSEPLETTSSKVSFVPTEYDVSSTRSTEFHKESSTATDGGITTEIVDERTTAAIEATKLSASTIPPTTVSKETTYLEEISEKITTTSKEFAAISDLVTKEGLELDKTTIATSQEDKISTISSVTGTPSAATSKVDVETSSILLPKPTEIETAIEIQPDTEPPLTEVVVGRYTTITPSTIEKEITTQNFSFGVEVITGASPEVQDQRTEAISLTTEKSVETTVEDSKATISIKDSITEKQTETVYPDIVELTTTSKKPEEVLETSHAEDIKGKTTESTSVIELETQSSLSHIAEDVTIASTGTEYTTRKSTVTGIAEEIITESPSGISSETTPEQEHLETTLIPKIVTSISAEEHKPTELKLDTEDETIIEKISTPESQSTELPLKGTEETITEITKIKEETSSVSEKTFIGTSATMAETKDIISETTPASQLEIKPVEVEAVEGTTQKQAEVTEESTSISKVLLVTTSPVEELSERTMPSISQETKTEVLSQEKTTLSTETHEESTAYILETTEKPTTHLASEDTTAEEVSTLVTTLKLTTKLPDHEEITVQTTEHTTESTSTASTETLKELITRAGTVETSDHTLGEITKTILEETTTIPAEKVSDSTIFSALGSTTAETTLHRIQDTNATASLATVSHTPEATDTSTDVEEWTSRGLDKTTSSVSIDVSVDITQKSSELTSTPPSKVLEYTTAPTLHEDESAVTSEISEETSQSTRVETTSRLLEEITPTVIIESISEISDRMTQKAEFTLTPTAEKSSESTPSAESSPTSTRDTTPSISEQIHKETTPSASEYPLLETTTKFTEEKVFGATDVEMEKPTTEEAATKEAEIESISRSVTDVETEKSTLTTTEKILTKEPETVSEVSEITSKLSITPLLEITSTPSATSKEYVTELTATTTEKEAERLTTESVVSLSETQQTDIGTSTQTYVQPEVPSEEPHKQDITIQDIFKQPVTVSTPFTKEEERVESVTESEIPFIRTEASSTTQILPQTEVPSEEPHKEDITIQETSTEHEIGFTKITTEKVETESAFSSTEIHAESTTQIYKQPEVPSEIPGDLDKVESSRPPVEQVTQSTTIHEEIEKTVKGQTETTAVSTELEQTTTQPLVTERLPIEQETERVSKVTDETLELTTLFEGSSTITKFLTSLSTEQTILDKSTSIVTEIDKSDVKASTTQQITPTTRPPYTKEQEQTTETSFWTSWFSSSAPTTHVETSSETTPVPPAITTTSISSPKTESTEDSSEEPIFVQKGACVFNGIVYQSAEQIPRTDACEFCFCFRGDIICLHQGCPPPMTLCYEREVPGFCCPHYVCHSPKPLYNISDHVTRHGRLWKRSAEVKGCEANGETYRVGEIMQRFSTPCLQCKCDPNGSMTCEPQKCKPQEPLLLKLNKEFFRKRQ